VNNSRFLAALSAPFVVGGLLHFAYPLVQPADYHHFADTRLICGVHNGADVLSNLAILAAGLVNLHWCWRHRASGAVQMPSLLTVSLGFVMAAAGSAVYHLRPTDATLVWDRLPMTVIFAGVLAMLYTSVTGRRVLWLQLASLVAAAMLTALIWARFGELWPYALLQFGGLAAVVGFTISRKVANPSGWWALICSYGVAKLFEMFDASIWVATDHVLAGHSLKHIACGAAGVALLGIVKPLRSSESNTSSRRLFAARRDPLRGR
jgi:hypothetical protein